MASIIRILCSSDWNSQDGRRSVFSMKPYPFKFRHSSIDDTRVSVAPRTKAFVLPRRIPEDILNIVFIGFGVPHFIKPPKALLPAALSQQLAEWGRLVNLTTRILNQRR